MRQSEVQGQNPKPITQWGSGRNVLTSEIPGRTGVPGGHGPRRRQPRTVGVKVGGEVSQPGLESPLMAWQGRPTAVPLLLTTI